MQRLATDTNFVVSVDILAASNCMSSSSVLFCCVQLTQMASAYSRSGLIKICKVFLKIFCHGHTLDDA